MKKCEHVLVIGGAGFIGTNLVENLLSNGMKVTIFDKNKPLSNNHMKYWVEGDFLNKGDLIKVIDDILPDFLVDLAARTDVDNSLSAEEGYSVNYEGVKNIIDVVQKRSFIKKIVFTSTQYVIGPNKDYSNIENYSPHTTYGQSKVIMEELIKDADIECEWTIIRPTNVWGPWHYRYKDQFFKVLNKGLYFHPGGEEAIKSYAYVGNLVQQVFLILKENSKLLDRETLYVGDEPISILKWANALSNAIAGKNIFVIPKWIFILLVKIGDCIGWVTRKAFLINSSRYNSMTEHYKTPMKKTFDYLGEPQFTLSEGVSRTMTWLKSVDSDFK